LDFTRLPLPEPVRFFGLRPAKLFFQRLPAAALSKLRAVLKEQPHLKNDNSHGFC
jgi:hypothetical protein